MGRTEKEIPEEILKQAEENPEQQEELAQEAGVSKKTLKNRIKKVNLQTSFIADTGDKQNINSFDNNLTENEEKVTLEPQQYDAVAMSAVMLMDGMGLMMKNIGNMLLKSKGKELEYDVLSETEKTFMVTQLKSQPEALNFLAQNDFMMPVLAFGSILATFVMHFKIKDTKKEEKKTENGNKNGNKKETILPKKEIIIDSTGEKKEEILEKKEVDKLKNIKLNIKNNNYKGLDKIPDARKDPIDARKVDFL